MLFALENLSANEGMAKRALEWLTQCQNYDGGYGVSPGGPSVAFATARCATAFRMHGVSLSDDRIKRGISWLLRIQKSSGGFSMAMSYPEDPELTAYVITTLSGIEIHRGCVDKAVEYLARVQEADGSFVSYAPIQFNGQSKRNTQTACFVALAMIEMLEKSRNL